MYKIRTLLIIIWTLATAPLLADVEFSAMGPSTVIAEQPFQIHYTVNDKGRDFRIADFNDFEILAGPFTSTSSSMSFVNGKRSSSYEQRYTFTLMANNEGTYTIPPAQILVDGTKYTSNGLKIKVLPPDQVNQNQESGAKSQGPDTRSQQQNQQTNKSQASADEYNAEVANDNIFIRTSLSKARVHEQECILLTYKLYSLVDVIQFTGSDIPDFTGFVRQEIDMPRNTQLQPEHYKGRNYMTAVLYQALIFPQHSGTLQIPKATFDAVIRVRNQAQSRSIFDSWFDSYVNVNKTLHAPGAKVTVDPLPSPKPSGFSGAVGTFDMKSDISATEVKSNEAITVKITITGNGNLKLAKTPVLNMPGDFEVYDPKITNNFQTGASGVSGSKTIEYLAIPRSSGDFTIPSAEFSYFDLQSKSYKTLRTPEYSLKVLPSVNEGQEPTVNSYVNQKEDVKQLGKDIRYIHTVEPQVNNADPLLRTTTAWLIFLLPLLLFILASLALRKHLNDISDVGRMKNKKANKVAQKRLKIAKKFAQENNCDKFYDEILRASWSYMGDKLGIPTADLNKSNVEQALLDKNVDADTIAEFLDVLNTAEFARFAPSSSDHAMQDLYERTADVIGKLENKI